MSLRDTSLTLIANLLIREVLHWIFEEGETVVSDEVSKVILIVVVAVSDQSAVVVNSVIVEGWVFDQTHPLLPPCRNVSTIIVIQVLTKITCKNKLYNISNLEY